MDFITDLPHSGGFDSILVVVDRFSKMSHFLPCHKAISSEETARLVFKEVFRFHGLPRSIITDRGSQFVAKFWRCLMKLLGIKAQLSSGYHPETDGQSESTNQTLEQYLRCFINYQQDNCVDLLPLAEFAYNNSLHSSIGVSPFYANVGCCPRWDLEATTEDTTNPAATDRLSLLQATHEQLQVSPRHAQETQKKATDQHRKVGPSFGVGDQVWLIRHQLKTTRPCSKLDYQRLGPFKIKERINDVTFRLELLFHMRIHPVFHVSLLEPYHTNRIPGRHLPPPPPFVLEDEEEYEVASVLDSKISRGRLFYFVDWKGYTPNDRTWEPTEHLEHAADKVAEFHRRYPQKPGPIHPATRGTRR